MGDVSGFESIPIGFRMGPLTLLIDPEMVRAHMERVQWRTWEAVENGGYAPPGMTVIHRAKMKFSARPDLKVAIWTKTAHEFIAPFRIGTTVTICGVVKEKYTKRGRNYLVTEYKTVDEDGSLLMRSRETGLHID